MRVISNSSGGDMGDEKCLPPGFRFFPTDEELVLYFLKRKICRRRLRPQVIGEVDVYKWEPEELPGQSLLKSGDRQWFFFSPRDRKYPNGGRSNRATRNGYWKVTGKDRHITYSSRTVGVKKTLIYYLGRAPNGERTDWVMHEYTMDEEELKRCQNAQDYYALNKVYKKSGAGPKNGEQYGAPFREEDWADDDCFDNHCSAEQENPSQQLNSSVEQSQFLDDMEEFLRQLTDEPESELPNMDEFPGLQQQFVGEEEAQSTMVEPSQREPISVEPSIVLPPLELQYDLQDGFGHSATSNLQSCEAPEVTCASNIHEKEAYAVEEDYLEINDLLGPEPNFTNNQIEERTGLDDPDLYFDAAMFLQDIGPIDQGTSSHPYIGNDIATQFGYYDLPSLQDGGDHSSSQLWVHDQRYNVFESTESSQVIMTPPVSGTVCTSINNPLNEAAQNQQSNRNNSPESWYTSAVWSLLESIPSHPASASENALINRALERISSFGRVGVNIRNTNVASSEHAATERRARRIGGFFLLSVLIVLFAILWMLFIRTTVKS